MDNKDSILILGAGIYQVPLIKKAQEMGLRAVITSGLAVVPADRVRHVSPLSVEYWYVWTAGVPVDSVVIGTLIWLTPLTTLAVGLPITGADGTAPGVPVTGPFKPELYRY